MKSLVVLLSFTLACNAMETPPGTDLPSPRPFASMFHQVKNCFEKIKDACTHQTNQSIATVDTLVTQLQVSPHQELVSLLWYKHYRFEVAKQFSTYDNSLTADLALLVNERLRYLLHPDQDCLERANARVDTIKKANLALWDRIGKIEFIRPPESILTQEFLTLRNKLDLLVNQVFASSTRTIDNIEAINKDLLNSPFKALIPLLWNPHVKTFAASGHLNYLKNQTDYDLTLSISQKIDELHEKVCALKEHP
ncbi:hypothetical protein BH09DEP1_BH09DEP1_1900 [soil metagenome]